MAFPRKGATGTTWYVEYTLASGKRQREATECTTRRAAELLESELRVREERKRLGLEAQDRNPGKHTMGTLVTWYLAETSKTANARHLSDTLKAHVVGDFASMRIEHVDGPTMQAFLAAFAKKPLKDGSERSANSVNRLRAYLSGMFRAARIAGLLVGDNPVALTRARKVEAPAPRPLPAHLVRPILAAADGAWRLPITLAVWTGMRFSEIARLQWSDVDLVDGVIYVRKTKAGKQRVVPIHPELLADLVDAKARGLSLTPNRGLASDAVRRALKWAGVAPAEVDGVDVCFKVLRSTWASQWVVCGAPGWIVEWVGWGPREGSVMQRHYIGVPTATLKQEILKLDWPSLPPSPTTTAPTSESAPALAPNPPQGEPMTEQQGEEKMKRDDVKTECRRRDSNPHDPCGPKDFKSDRQNGTECTQQHDAAGTSALSGKSSKNGSGGMLGGTYAAQARFVRRTVACLLLPTAESATA